MISRHINDLENEFQLKLFFRTTKGLVLTSQGKILMEQSELIMSEIEKTKSILLNSKNEPEESLTILTPTVWASSFIIDYITEFLSKYPKISLNIISDDQDPSFYPAENCVAITPYTRQGQNLVRRKLVTVLRIVASKAYIEKFVANSVSDLKEHKLIASSDRNKYFMMLIGI